MNSKIRQKRFSDEMLRCYYRIKVVASIYFDYRSIYTKIRCNRKQRLFRRLRFILIFSFVRSISLQENLWHSKRKREQMRPQSPRFSFHLRATSLSIDIYIIGIYPRTTECKRIYGGKIIKSEERRRRLTSSESYRRYNPRAGDGNFEDRISLIRPM